MVDLLERIDVMLKQEASVYKTEDYLAPEFQQKLSLLMTDAADEMPSCGTVNSSSSTSSSSGGINELWREKICEWSYQVIDHFDFSREVVSVSIHLLDRYLSTRTVNKKVFQLAAMTTLFLAIKLYEPGKLSMSSMIELSRGFFLVEQMAAMEVSILRALKWQVHPPTTYCFAKHLLFLLPFSSVPMDTRHDVLELARFLTELSVIDYYFVAHEPSAIALAALQNSMDLIPGASDVARQEFLKELRRVSRLNIESPQVAVCRDRLRLLYAQGGYACPAEARNDMRTEAISPVCVSAYPQFYQPVAPPCAQQISK